MSGKVLFAIFIFNTVIWFAKRVIPKRFYDIWLKWESFVGVHAAVTLNMAITLARVVLLYLSVEYIYFGNYYYYVSVAAIALTSLLLLLLLLGLLVMCVTKDRKPMIPKSIAERKTIYIEKIQANVAVGFLFRLILAAAWLRTFEYFDVTMHPHVEALFVVVLYALTIYIVAYGVIMTKRERSQGCSKTS